MDDYQGVNRNCQKQCWRGIKVQRSCCYTTSDSVLVREVDDGAVLLDLTKDCYFGLNPVGLRIWHLIESNTSLEEIIDTLLAEYAVGQSQLKDDVEALVSDLEKRGLVTVQNQRAIRLDRF